MTFENESYFKFDFREASYFEFGFNEVIQSGEFAKYTGSYTVTPKIQEQELETKDKTCTQNIKVAKIPYYEVDNLQNGKTIIIGG